MFSTAIYAVVDAERPRAAVGLRRPSAAAAGPRAATAARALTVDAVHPLLLMPLDHIPTTPRDARAGRPGRVHTDGITERLDGQEQYTSSNGSWVCSIAAAAFRRGAGGAVIADVSAFAAGHESEDDQTLVVVGFP